MEELIYQISECIQGNLPEVITVDEDYGQLNIEENESFGFPTPAVLIGTPETVWESQGPKTQRGKCTVRISLLLDCINGAYGSTAVERMLYRRRLADNLHSLLQGKKIAGFNVMNRVSSVTQSLLGEMVVYQTDYEVVVFETVENN